jgi:hypothetical protein
MTVIAISGFAGFGCQWRVLLLCRRRKQPMASNKKKRKAERQEGVAPSPTTPFERVVMALLAGMLLVMVGVAVEVAQVMVLLLRIIIHGG